MNLLDLVRSSQTRNGDPLAFDDWVKMFSYNGLSYGLTQTLTGGHEEIGSDFVGLVRGAHKSNGIVYACEMARVSIFSEARFVYRQLRNGRPGKTFSLPQLDALREPWPGGTTGDLLSRMLLDADYAGNAYVSRRPGDRYKRLRPDWMTILVGIPDKVGKNDDPFSPDAEVIGYLYHPGGKTTERDPIPFLPNEIAHFAPSPDPEAFYRGMSWLNPVVTDILGDKAAAAHKLKFFENGATPNLIVGFDVSDPDKFDSWVEIFRENYEGSLNAYKTMFLGAGADAKVVGSDFQQIDFKKTQGAGETRIAAAAGVPAVIVGLSEGLSGSSLNAGNYAMARRRLGDGTLRPLWRNVCGSLAKITPIPPAAELWYDDKGIPFLREDIKDEAEIAQKRASTISSLITAGFKPDVVVDAVMADDLERLEGGHTGLFSVQLQPPNSGENEDARASFPLATARELINEGWRVVSIEPTPPTTPEEQEQA